MACILPSHNICLTSLDKAIYFKKPRKARELIVKGCVPTQFTLDLLINKHADVYDIKVHLLNALDHGVQPSLWFTILKKFDSIKEWDQDLIKLIKFARASFASKTYLDLKDEIPAIIKTMQARFSHELKHLGSGYLAKLTTQTIDTEDHLSNLPRDVIHILLKYLSGNVQALESLGKVNKLFRTMTIKNNLWLPIERNFGLRQSNDPRGQVLNYIKNGTRNLMLTPLKKHSKLSLISELKIKKNVFEQQASIVKYCVNSYQKFKLLSCVADLGFWIDAHELDKALYFNQRHLIEELLKAVIQTSTVTLDLAIAGCRPIYTHDLLQMGAKPTSRTLLLAQKGLPKKVIDQILRACIANKIVPLASTIFDEGHCSFSTLSLNRYLRQENAND